VDQKLEPLAGEEAVADDANGPDRDDVVSAHIETRGFAVQRHPLVDRWRVEHERKPRIGKVVQQPRAAQPPEP